jgi:hypothetical protein
MFGKITLAATLVVSGVAFGQNTPQPSSTSTAERKLRLCLTQRYEDAPSEGRLG